MDAIKEAMIRAEDRGEIDQQESANLKLTEAKIRVPQQTAHDDDENAGFWSFIHSIGR